MIVTAEILAEPKAGILTDDLHAAAIVYIDSVTILRRSDAWRDRETGIVAVSVTFHALNANEANRTLDDAARSVGALTVAHPETRTIKATA